MGNLKEGGLSKIEVLERGIAPASIGVGQGKVRGAEVGGSDGNGARVAPFGVIVAFHLVTRPTAQPTVEESCAECCRVGPIPLAVQVAITTSPTCKYQTTPPSQPPPQKIYQSGEPINAQ